MKWGLLRCESQCDSCGCPRHSPADHRGLRRAPSVLPERRGRATRGKTEGWEFSQTCLQGAAWAEEFGGWEGLGEQGGETPALEDGGGEADYCPGAGLSWGGSRGGWARGGKRDGVEMWGGGGVGGGGLHLGTRQEMKKCSDWEKELRTAPSFLLRHQLSWALK